MPFDAQLAAQMDASLSAYWGAYAQNEHSQYREFPGALLLYTPIPLSLFNSVILTAQDASTISAALDAAAEEITRHGREVMWRVGVNAQSEGLRAELERAGLEPEGREPAMLMPLSDLRGRNGLDGLEIRAAEGRSGRYDWASLTCDAFELDADTRKAMSECEAAAPEMLFASQLRYTGYLEGAPVAVSSLVMTGDIAGIYAVATLPHARRKGIGTVMTYHAMAEGKRQGARHAVLQATEMGQPVYESLGFSAVFDYEIYLQK